MALKLKSRMNLLNKQNRQKTEYNSNVVGRKHTILITLIIIVSCLHILIDSTIPNEKKNVDFHYSETLRALRKVQFCRQTKASLYILLIHSLLLLLLLFSLEDQRIFIFFFFFCFNSRSHTDVAVFYYFWLTINCIKLFFCFCLNPQKKALLFCIAHTLDTINVFVHNGRQHRMNTFSVMIKKKISEKHFFFVRFLFVCWCWW